MPDDRLDAIRARLAALPNINFASTSPEDCYGEPLPEGQVADLRWCLIDRDEDDPALAEGWRPIIEWMANAPADVAWLLDQLDQERANADRARDLIGGDWSGATDRIVQWTDAAAAWCAAHDARREAT
jgi:hypothetical protein